MRPVDLIALYTLCFRKLNGHGHLILPCSTALGITKGSIVSKPLLWNVPLMCYKTSLRTEKEKTF
jgi:hypothetical protein